MCNCMASLNYFSATLMSFCNRVLSASELIVRYSRISSAYNLIFEVTFRGILFTKHKKVRGLKLFFGVRRMLQQKGNC